jgi:hypothetical protein
MPGLGPGIHEFSARQPKELVDGRDKPGHDWAPLPSDGQVA